MPLAAALLFIGYVIWLRAWQVNIETNIFSKLSVIGYLTIYVLLSQKIVMVIV